MARSRPILLYAASESNADMLYATQFRCPDPFVYVRTTSGTRVMVMRDLEIDRARSTAAVDRVLSYTRFETEQKEALRRRPHTADVIAAILRDLGVRSVNVPGDFPIVLADRLRRRNVGVHVGPDPFFEKRARKNPDEVAAIRRTMRAAEAGMRAAVNMIASARVRNGWLVSVGKRLTAEAVRSAANAAALTSGAMPANTIVAPGAQGCDPHERGSGAIRAGAPIIIDIFPRSETSGYFGDMTRTVVRGEPDEFVAAMYRAVREAQKLAVDMVRPGVPTSKIHRAVQEHFRGRGFQTGEVAGRRQGFFHGTGHGLGLEIHEAPRVAAVSDVLAEGMVITVEPGLYYHPHGGVRIEDTVLVGAKGARNLTRFSKRFRVGD